MELFEIGDRVRLKKSALSVSYIAGRHWYMDIYEGKRGKIIGTTAAKDKYAVEFDEECFTNYAEKLSSFDNGCHKKGKLHHCIYIPLGCVETDMVSGTDNALIAIL